jgi:hypothetical protein
VNDPDATYCKKCGAQIGGKDTARPAEAPSAVVAAPSVPPPAEEPER